MSELPSRDDPAAPALVDIVRDELLCADADELCEIADHAWERGVPRDPYWPRWRDLAALHDAIAEYLGDAFVREVLT